MCGTWLESWSKCSKVESQGHRVMVRVRQGPGHRVRDHRVRACVWYLAGVMVEVFKGGERDHAQAVLVPEQVVHRHLGEGQGGGG